MQSADNPFVLVINPGSTSTKLALFAVGDTSIVESKTRSIASGPIDFGEVPDTGESIRARMQREAEVRYEAAVDFVGDASLSCVAARGGLVKPVRAGTYAVDEAMIDDLLSCRYGRHPSNLGAPIASAVARIHGCPAIIADPVGVDEFDTRARFSGFRGIERRSFSHALNLRAVARRTAADLDISFETSRFVGVHLGGGISVASMIGGRIVDVNNSNEGGPFTPQRTGSLPILQLIDLCFSGAYDSAEALKNELITRGGLVSYLGTSSVEEAISRIDDGDVEVRSALEAMVFQIAKEIGAAAAVLDGHIDAVFLTGGFARPPISEWLIEKIGWIGPVSVHPGEGEMVALAEAAARVIRNEDQPLTY